MAETVMLSARPQNIVFIAVVMVGLWLLFAVLVQGGKYLKAQQNNG